MAAAKADESVRTAEPLLELLEPVRWEQGTMHLTKTGLKQYVEAGPGKQLKAMMRRIDQDAWSKTITLDA